jgi:hypothetical protein
MPDNSTVPSLPFREIIYRLLQAELPDKAVIPLSYTRVNTLLSCPYKFLMQYGTQIDKPIKSKMKSDGNTAGSIVHSVFEDYLSYYSYNTNTFSVDFDLCWVQSRNNYEQKNGPIPTSARELLETFRTGTESCAHQVTDMVYKNNLRMINEFKFTVGNDFSFTRVNQYPFRDSFFFYGAADLLLFNKDHTQALIVDWKTYSRSKDKVKDEQNNLQLDMYKYFLFKWFQKLHNIKSIDVAIAYVPDCQIVRFNDPITIHNEQEISIKTRNELSKYVLAVDTFVEQFYSGDVPKTPYEGCRYCDFNLFCKDGHDFGLRKLFREAKSKKGITLN